MSSLVQLFIKLEWKVSRQYPLRIALNLFHILMILCLFFFISQTLGSVPFLKGTYFPFVATGLCFHSFFSGLINASPSKTLEWRDIGVLESLAMSPTPLWKLFLTAGSYEMLLAFMKSLFIFCGLFILADISVMPLVLLATIFMSFLMILS